MSCSPEFKKLWLFRQVFRSLLSPRKHSHALNGSRIAAFISTSLNSKRNNPNGQHRAHQASDIFGRYNQNSTKSSEKDWKPALIATRAPICWYTIGYVVPVSTFLPKKAIARKH